MAVRWRTHPLNRAEANVLTQVQIDDYNRLGAGAACWRGGVPRLRRLASAAVAELAIAAE